MLKGCITITVLILLMDARSIEFDISLYHVSVVGIAASKDCVFGACNLNMCITLMARLRIVSVFVDNNLLVLEQINWHQPIVSICFRNVN